MCLNISNKRNKLKEAYLKANKPNSKGFIKGYKLFARYGCKTFKTPYQYLDVKFGWNYSSRLSNELSISEKLIFMVDYGCHFYLNKNDIPAYQIKKITRTKWSMWATLPIYFKPEDLVVIGKFAGRPSAVVMKYYLPKPKVLR